jgi:hypothetical protein
MTKAYPAMKKHACCIAFVCLVCCIAIVWSRYREYRVKLDGAVSDMRLAAGYLVLYQNGNTNRIYHLLRQQIESDIVGLMKLKESIYATKAQRLDTEQRIKAALPPLGSNYFYLHEVWLGKAGVEDLMRIGDYVPQPDLHTQLGSVRAKLTNAAMQGTEGQPSETSEVSGAFRVSP